MRFLQAEHFYTTNNPKWIVIHDMEYPKRAGAANWCAHYFAPPNAPRKSAHYCIDPFEIVQSVREDNGAWHTQGFIQGLEINRASIGIEHAGYANQSRAQWLQDGVSELEQSAQLVAGIAARWNIPIRHLTVDEIKQGLPGIAGHVEFNRASGTGDHTDPGPNFPWDWYIDRVRGNRVLQIVNRNPVTIALAAAVGLGIWSYYTQPSFARNMLRKLGL